jgi:hypothetical protein
MDSTLSELDEKPLQDGATYPEQQSTPQVHRCDLLTLVSEFLANGKTRPVVLLAVRGGQLL